MMRARKAFAKEGASAVCTAGAQGPSVLLGGLDGLTGAQWRAMGTQPTRSSIRRALFPWGYGNLGNIPQS